MTLQVIAILIAIFGCLANAIPTIAFPLNSQVPPVARVAEPFNYTFSNSTFTSPLPLSYTLSNGPSWLSLDPNTRTLFGTPSLNEVGDEVVMGIAVGLTATDSTGSATLNATIVISKNTGPVVNIPISSQISQLGVSSAPSTLTYYPSAPFSFNFNADTFVADGGNTTLIYYAVTDTNTPLPSWISFDSTTLAFSGQTPDYQSLIQPPQTFGINLISSDVPGFSAATISFYVEVGVHVLSFSEEIMTINATAGTKVNFNGLTGSLQLDGQAVHGSNLTTVTAQTPAWINFDNTTLTLTGIVPQDASPYNITIQATDIYDDTATAVVLIDVTGTILATSTLTSGPSPSTNGFASSTSKAPPTSKTKGASAQAIPSSGSHKLGTRIWLAIFIPIIILLLGLLLAVFCCFYRRQMIKEPPAPQKREISTPLENTSRIEIVITPPRVSPPKPLELDLGLGLSLGHHGVVSQEGEVEQQSPTLTPNNIQKEGLRRSKTMDIGLEAVRESRVIQSENLKHPNRQTRSCSDNGLSTIGSSWRSTKDSSYTIDNSMGDLSRQSLERMRSQGSHRLSRNFSNHSRKGHARRSARMISFQSTNQGDSTMIRQTEDSTVGLGDIHFSSRPITVISIPQKSGPPAQQRESPYSRNKTILSARRQSRFPPTLEVTQGIGHGVRGSISSLSAASRNRSSIGHGQNNTSFRRTQRESKAWLTVVANDNSEQNRESIMSASSIYEDTIPRKPIGKSTIRQVTHSPSIQVSEGSRHSLLFRPISRRISSSPFFSSRHSRKSLRSPKIARTSYADSPTVPEEGPMTHASLEETIHYGLREGHSGQPRDSYVMSYGLAKEGTRQLRSYIKSQLVRNRTGQSMYSIDSRDSRFESATASMLSLPQQPAERQTEDVFQDSMQENPSEEGSWETAPRTIIDSEGNAFYGQGGREETPQAVVAAVRAVVERREDVTGSKEDVGIGPSVRLVRGVGRRPISSDGKSEKRSSIAVVEDREADYTAYI